MKNSQIHRERMIKEPKQSLDAVREASHIWLSSTTILRGCFQHTPCQPLSFALSMALLWSFAQRHRDFTFEAGQHKQYVEEQAASYHEHGT